MADSYNKLFGLGTHTSALDINRWPTKTDLNSSIGTGGNLSAVGFTPTFVDRGFYGVASTFGSGRSLITSGNGIPLNATTGYVLFARYEDLFTDFEWNTAFRGEESTTLGHPFLIEKDTDNLGLFDNLGSSSFVDSGADLTTSSASIALVCRSSSLSEFYIDGLLVGTVSVGIDCDLKSLGNHFAGNGSQPFSGRFGDAATVNGVLSASQVLEIHNGPEPLSTTPPTLGSDGQVTSGSRDSQNNGPLVYSTGLHLASDDSLIATLTGVDPDFSSDIQPGTDYYVIERARNDGGFDEAEDSQSATTRSNGGVEVNSGSGDIESESSFSGSGSASRSGSGSISSEGTFAGTGQSVNSGTSSFESIGIAQGSGTSPRSGDGSIDSIGVNEGSGRTENSGDGIVNSTGNFTSSGSTPDTPNSGSGDVESIGVVNGSGSTTQSGSSGSGEVESIGSSQWFRLSP